MYQRRNSSYKLARNAISLNADACIQILATIRLARDEGPREKLLKP